MRTLLRQGALAFSLTVSRRHGAPSAKWGVHIRAYSEYEILDCIYCIFMHICAYNLHIFCLFCNVPMPCILMHICAYFVHIFCIFMHRCAYFTIAYLCIFWSYSCIFEHIFGIWMAYGKHTFCIFYAYLFHILCICMHIHAYVCI